MHIIDTRKIPLTRKGGKLWPDVDYRVKGNSEARQPAHSYISRKALFCIFREAWSVVSSSSFLPGRLSWAPLLPTPHPQVSTCQAAPVRTPEDRSRVPGGQAGGRWGGSDVRESREARQYCGRGRAEPAQTPGHLLSFSSQPTCCPLHCLSLTTPFISTEIFLLSTAAQNSGF